MSASAISHNYSPQFVRFAQTSLEELLRDVPNVIAAVIASADGFEIADASRSGISANRLSALSSSLLALGQASLRELQFRGAGTVLIENEGGKIYVAEAPVQPYPAVLCVIADHDALIGKVLWAARRCVTGLISQKSI